MKVEEYARLKSKIDALRQQMIRAEGALEQAEKRLKTELGVSVPEAGRKVAELEKQAERLKGRVERRLDEFAERWSERLEETG